MLTGKRGYSKRKKEVKVIKTPRSVSGLFGWLAEKYRKNHNLVYEAGDGRSIVSTPPLGRTKNGKSTNKCGARPQPPCASCWSVPETSDLRKSRNEHGDRTGEQSFFRLVRHPEVDRQDHCTD